MHQALARPASGGARKKGKKNPPLTPNTIPNCLEERVEIKNSERLKQGLYKKLLSCRKDQEAFFDAQNESGHLLLAMVVDKSPEELQDLLSLR